ncbi:MAG: phosphatase PAP2 family protein [Ktedonobacterales bacterium]
MAITRLGLDDPEQAPKPVGFITAVVLMSLAAAVGALVLFTWVAEEMLEGATARFDMSVRMCVHGFASPTLTSVMRFITEMGSSGLAVVAVAAIGIFVARGWKRGVGWIVISLAGATVLSVALKYGFHRPRPVPFFAALPHSYSFPSGHALFSFCFYGVLGGLIAARVKSLWLRVVVWASAVALVLAIGVSRIYLGVHYPSDVLAGYLAALVWVSSLVLADRVRKTRKGLKVATASDPPVE